MQLSTQYVMLMLYFGLREYDVFEAIIFVFITKIVTLAVAVLYSVVSPINKNTVSLFRKGSLINLLLL